MSLLASLSLLQGILCILTVVPFNMADLRLLLHFSLASVFHYLLLLFPFSFYSFRFSSSSLLSLLGFFSDPLLGTFVRGPPALLLFIWLFVSSGAVSAPHSGSSHGPWMQSMRGHILAVWCSLQNTFSSWNGNVLCLSQSLYVYCFLCLEHSTLLLLVLPFSHIFP